MTDDSGWSFPGDDEGSDPSADMDPVCLAFLQDLEGSADPDAILRDYAARHPGLAGELRGLAAMRGLLNATADRAAPSLRLERLGDFRIIDEIGRGGMGMVYEAAQEPFGRRVAVKTIRGAAARSPDPNRLRRFLREQEVLSKLHHTHIVPIYAAGVDGMLHYYAMQYVEGVSLNRVVAAARAADWTAFEPPGPTLADLVALAEREPAAPADADVPAVGDEPPTATSVTRYSPRYVASIARALADAADALDHAHSRKILHRDLKPSNLMLDREGHCWVLDFGLAALLGRPESSSHAGRNGDVAALESTVPDATEGVVGTPLYLAPERREGHCDERTDVWGLGVTLYELLALRRPPSEGLAGRSDDAVQPLTARGVPRDLVAVCVKAMRRDPAERYPSVAHLRDDLVRFLEGMPVDARPAGPARRMWLWSRRNPWLAGLNAVIVLMVGAVLLVSLGWALDTAEKRGQLENLRADLERQADELERRTREVDDEAALNSYNYSRLLANRQAPALLAQAWGVRLAVRSGSRMEVRSRHQLAAIAAMEFGQDLEALIDVPQPINHAALRPDGRAIAVAADSGDVLIRAVEEGARPTRLRRHAGPVRCVAYAPAGSLMASGGDDHAARLWREDQPASEPIVLRHPAAVLALAFDPTGERILTGAEDGVARLWSTADGALLSELAGHEDAIAAVAFGADGRTLLTGSRDRTARIWDAQTGMTRHRLVHRGEVAAAALSPDCRLAVTGSGDQAARLWDAADGSPRGQPMRHDAGVSAIVFTADGRRVLTSSEDARSRFWDASNGAPDGAWFDTSHNVMAAQTGGGGRRVMTAAKDGSVYLWSLPEPPTSYELPDLGTTRFDLVVNSDRTWVVAYAGSRYALWSLADGRQVGPVLDLEKPITCAAFQPGGSTFAIATEDGATHWMDVELNPRTTRLDKSPLCAIAFRGDGAHVLGFRDGSFQLFDGVDSNVGPALQAGSPVTAAALSGDGRHFLVGCEDGTFRLWRTDVSEVGGPRRHGGRVVALAFNRDGTRFLVGDDVGAVRLWSTADASPIGPPQTHGAAVRSLAFAPDDRSFVVLLRTGEMQIYDSEELFEIGPRIASPPGGVFVGLLDDGRTLARKTASGRLQFAVIPTPVDGTPDQITLWAEARTGMFMTGPEVEKSQSEAQWREKLRILGGWKPSFLHAPTR